MFNVFQMHLTDAQVDEVNSGGETPAFYKAYLDAKRLDGGVTAAENLGLYKHVANVYTNDKEDAFLIMNRWSDEDEEKVERLGRVASLSVGDKLVDEDGTEWVCSSIGFRII